MATCETCRFGHIVWLEGDEYYPYHGGYYSTAPETPHKRHYTASECRRHPPRMASVDGQQDGWPMVNAQSWCGDHQPKDAGNAE